MLELQPSAPWRPTYDRTAEAIAKVSEDDPLFDGPDGDQRTAAALVSLAWHESRFRLDAVSGTGPTRWMCLYQVQRENLTDPKLALKDAESCTRDAVRLMRISLTTCKELPPRERLAWYASGSCKRGTKASYARLWLADKLVRTVKRPESDPPPAAPPARDAGAS